MGYCTVDQFKRWTVTADLDTVEAGDAEQTIDAAAEQIDGYCGRTFTVAAVDPSPRSFAVRAGDRILFVDDFVGVATAVDDRGVAVTVEAVPASHGRPASMLRATVARSGLWTITARWGWPEVPAAVVQANVMLAAKIWNRRMSPVGVQGTVETGFVRVHGIDRDIEALLAPYVRLRGGFG